MDIQRSRLGLPEEITATTVEILSYRGYRILTRVVASAKGYLAEAWAVRLDRPGAKALPAGVATSRDEAEAFREAQTQARIAIEAALEDEALDRN